MKKTIYRPKYRRMLARLKQARIEAGLTQEEVAKRLKVEQTFVSKSELGDRRVDVIELMDFAKLYRKPLQYFLD